MFTCYNPYKKDAINKNKYIKLITDSIKLNNKEIYSLKETLLNYSIFKKTKIFNLNWYENIYTENKLKAYLEYYFKITLLYFLKINNKKIVWTMHNKEPHDSPNDILCKKMIMKCINISDRIVIHCMESMDVIKKIYKDDKILKKVIYIPHPNYINQYPAGNTMTVNDNKKLKILFMGQVRPYKNIELLIDIAEKFKNSIVEIIIAGNPLNDEYRKYLLSKTENIENIRMILRFIENEEIEPIIKSCDIMIFPYDINSSLNSGSILLAFSYKKTVIAPMIGTLKDFKNKELFFGYEYDNEKMHFMKIVDIIDNIIEMRKKDPNILIDIGEKVYEEVRSTNGQDVVYNKYKNLYDELT